MLVLFLVAVVAAVAFTLALARGASAMSHVDAEPPTATR